ncbi:hypothetical protein A1Q2_08051 [Trichosporon asahii var. asahii CBS 8904]|uniref:Uncharacterized protein n=2 Tax=Trichosporon asahii var. asahii TaxID=189963 RepID=K1VAC3_TRIAC|nr:hypothetical protein A1Q1_02019 [Trichosporon asahii var. asahii CBS 2479]EJT48924.1 hypothetical protein A1Q1_02019 [Trichosporon asahii var. asahii CBS 2479]EKC97670.1 hypothetical protein A1Q2_08051 [Trichosporon asahii var. asahii CBS 8904]
MSLVLDDHEHDDHEHDGLDKPSAIERHKEWGRLLECAGAGLDSKKSFRILRMDEYRDHVGNDLLFKLHTRMPDSELEGVFAEHLAQSNSFPPPSVLN